MLTRPRVRRARRRRRAARRDRQRVDGQRSTGRAKRDVIGKRITFNSGIPREQQQVVGGPGSRVVIGVVGDVKHLGLDEERGADVLHAAHAAAVVPHDARGRPRRRRAGGADATGARGADADGPRSAAVAGDARCRARSKRRWPRRGCAPRCSACSRRWRWSLAAIGVYGVVAYMVGQRTQEIGVRRALGARAVDVMVMLVREAMRPVAIGIVLGVAGAFALTRAAVGDAVRDVGDRRDDLRCCVALVVALLASIMPARRALGVDPITPCAAMRRRCPRPAVRRR